MNYYQRQTKMKVFAPLVACSLIAIQMSSAATIPAGTVLVVRTNETISSDDPVGKTFAAQLASDVVVGRSVLLRAGAKVVGRVDSSRGLDFTPVILNVIQVATGGRMVPIRTVAGFRADGSRFKTRRGVSVGSGGFFQLPAGKIMQFQLAQPVSLGGRK